MPQHLHQAQLLYRLQSCAQIDVAQALAQGRIAQRRDFRSGDDLGTLAQANLARDRARRCRMIAGQHDDAYAGGATLGDRGGHIRTRRVDEPDQPEKTEIEIVLALRRLRALPFAAGHAEHTQTAFGHRFDLAQDRLALGGREVAQIDHRLRCALGREQVLRRRLAVEDTGHGKDVAGQTVLEFGSQFRVHVLGTRKPAQPEALDRFFHRIERIDRGRQHRELGELVKRFGQILGAFVAEYLSGGGQLRDLHAVLGQRAGLVDCQHADRTERFHCRHAPGQHLVLGDPPRAKRQKHRENDRDLFRQNRHGEGDSGKHAFQECVSIPEPAEQAIRGGEQQAADRQVADQLARA